MGCKKNIFNIPEMETETKSEDKWLQSLVLLFQACEPLTHDSRLTKEEFAERQRNIERHTFYCLHVKLAIEDGVEPLSWDDWSDKEKRFEVEGHAFKTIIERDRKQNTEKYPVFDCSQFENVGERLTDLVNNGLWKAR